ncbi:hypothetical protein A7Q01_00895 [Eikenella sp. NML96-A-049]|uniref:DUF551 domain-containing protein n=1 Tax=unclassified Eikenella TaxID=2639367 RepID=UPI0007DEFA00|nr:MULTISPECIES: DUF551 domain-containing protein [unclassified Eikenella]OAM33543.1 hypothetical protein A7P97_08170 [Eikenella sp. NML070372]OAM42476.1 hypothetical protein A7Q01_00895 [Eikenella sp. NML96-A-049]
MTPERIEQERLAFEERMAELYPTNPQTERVGEEYSRLGTQYKWEGWQARAAQSEWISVEDRLPEAGENILIILGKGRCVRCSIYEPELEEFERLDVTHWQPFRPPAADPAA